MAGTYNNYNASFFSVLKSAAAIWLFVFVLVIGSASSRDVDCPFHYMFHTGDGFFDIGNAVNIPYVGPMFPANNAPYGMTYPGYPSGRWTDGLTDIDIGGAAMGFTEIMPYLSGNASTNATVFAVIDSPILDRSFFNSIGVKIPLYAAPLSIQLSWFQNYLNSICSTPTECADKMGDSLFLFGDVEANDIAIPLIQGKSIEEVTTYVPLVNEAQMNAARELISLGATRIIFTGDAPIGCYPFILTKLASNDPTDYDDTGCLWKINDLIKFKNNELQRVIHVLNVEFPNLIIMYADMYSAFEKVLQISISGPNKNLTLKACCGTGGEYNFDSSQFCGTSGVPVCDDPNQYIHWDGKHLTQAANNRISMILQPGVFPTLNCTPVHRHLHTPIYIKPIASFI